MSGALFEYVEAMAHGVDVGEFIARRGVLNLRRIAVEPGGADHGQPLRREFQAQLGNDGSLRLAVRTPMRPEEKQDRRALELRKS